MREVILSLLFVSCAGIIGNESLTKTENLKSPNSDIKNNNQMATKEEKKVMKHNNNSHSSFIQSFTLSNGLRLIVEEDHSARVVAIQAWVSVGSADETDDIAGVAHLHEHMLFKGTKRRKVGEIARVVEENGGDINAWTSFDDTVYHLVMPSDKYEMGLDIISDVLMNSSFDSKELAKEKEVVLEEIRQNRDIPQRRLIDELFSLSYTAHPYKRPVIGYSDTVKNITRQKIYDFYKRFYVPQNIIIVVVGDISPRDVVSKAERLFDGFSGEVIKRERTPEPAQVSPRIKIIRDNFVEAQIGIAWHITDIKDEDTPVLDLISVLLGGSQSSKLRESIVVDKTLASDVFAYSYTPKDKGLFIIGAGLPYANIKETLSEIFNILLRYKYEKFSTGDVNKAIVQIESDDIFSLTTMQGRARKLGFYQMMTGDYNYGEKYLNRLRGITPEDISRVMQRYFSKENMSVVVLIPSTAQEKIIEEEEIVRMFSDSEDFYKKRAQYSSTERQIYKKVLKNRMTLILEKNSRLPIISIRAVSLGGVRYEDEKIAGISNFVARMLTRGNRSMNTFEIMRTMDNIGGSISGYSGKNSLGLKAEFLSKYQEIGIKTFFDCLFRSEFDEDQIEKERRLILEDIRNREDDMTFQAVQLFLNSLYKSHPYRFDILGTEESIRRISKEDLIKFYKKIVVPANTVVAVVGDIEPSTIEQMIEEYTRDIPGPAFEPLKLEPQKRPDNKITQYLYKEKEQAHIVVGFLGTTMYEKDRYALEVLSVVLGGQSGRFFVNLRDKRSLAYTVSAFNVEGIENGYFAIYLSCAHHKVKTAQEAIFDELRQLRSAGVGEDEVEKAKNYLIGIHSIEMQEYSLRAHLYSLDEIYGLGYDFHDRYIELIKSVTKEDVNSVIDKYIVLDNAIVAIVKSQVR